VNMGRLSKGLDSVGSRIPKARACPVGQWEQGAVGPAGAAQRWSRIFAQGVKWNFCLTAGKDSARESGETHEEESTPEPLTGLQG